MSDFGISVFRREPFPDEIEAAQREIERQELAISILEKRIQRLIFDVQELRKVQTEHTETIRRCKGVVTLARRIPKELLAKIFEHCVADGWVRAPVAVSHVCSSWRQAALSPRVWSHIYVNTDSPDILSRTRFWLSMARNAPLNISLLTSWRTNDSHLSELIRIINKKAFQWRVLSMENDMLPHANHALIRCPSVMENLREVRIDTQVHFDTELDGEESLPLGDAFNAERAPALIEVHLVCNVIPNDLSIPLHITILRLSIKESTHQRPLSASSILNLLEPLQSLKELTLTLPLFNESPYVTDADEWRTVTLPNLTKLTMYGPTDLNGILAHLRAPALLWLHLRSLEDKGYRQDPIGPTLLNFVCNGSPPLELLELHDIDLSPEYFAACFTALPELRTLRLHESSISDTTLRLLEASPGGLCPKLTRLDLRWCGHLTGRALVSLVSSRLKNSDYMPGAFYTGGQAAERIVEVGVLNCCYVLENDVLDLARMTVCRVCLRGNDYCRICNCCDNSRYRQRLRWRHMATLSKEESSQLRLVI